MSKYKYDDFIARKDLLQIIEESVPIILNAGCDPSEFYEAILARPEILTEEEALNEFLGGLRDRIGAAWGAAKNIGAAGRGKEQAKQLALLKSLSPEQQLQHGFTPDAIANLEKQQQNVAAAGQRGFGGNYAQNLQQNQQNRSIRDMQQRAGIGPYAPPAPYSPPGQQPVQPPASPTQPASPTNPTQPASPTNPTQAAPASPAPVRNPRPKRPRQPQSQASFDAQRVIQALQGMIAGRTSTKQLIPQIKNLLTQLQQGQPPATAEVDW